MRRGLFIFLAIVLSLQFCGSALSASSIVEFLLDLAIEDYQKGDYHQALKDLEKVLLIEPNNQEAQRWIERVLRKSRQKEERQMLSALDRLEGEPDLKPAETIWELPSVEAGPDVAFEAEPDIVVETDYKLAIEKQAAVQAQLNVLEPQVAQPVKKYRTPRRVETQPPAQTVTTISELPGRAEPTIPEWMSKAIPVALAEEARVSSADQRKPEPLIINRAQPRETITSAQLRGYDRFEGAQVFVGNQRIEMDPIIIRGNDIWLALENIAGALGLAVFYPEANSLMIIRDDGLPLEFRIGSNEVLVNKKLFLVMKDAVALYQGYVMLSLNALQSALDIFYDYSPQSQVVEISKARQMKFSSFTIKKPQAILEREKRERLAAVTTVPKRRPAEIREEFLPQEYYPDIDLDLESSFKYFHDMLDEKRTRYTEHYLTGEMYGFDVYGHLSMRDFETDLKRTFQEDAQHISFSKDGTTLRVLDNDFRLPRLKSQTQSYWGVQLDAEGEDAPIKHHAWAGEMDSVYISALDGGRSVQYTGKLYALQQDWIDRDDFELSAVELFTDNKSEFSSDGGATDYPRRNFVYLLDSDWRLIPELNFYNTLAQCFYTPDNQHQVFVSDVDFKSGVELDYDRFALNSSFEYVGDRFVSFGIPDSYQDFIGGDIAGSYRVTDYLNINLGANMSRDNVAFDLASPSSHSRGLSTSSFLDLPWGQTLNLGCSYNRFLNRGGTVVATGSEYRDYRVDYYKDWPYALLQLGWQRYDMDPLATSATKTLMDTYSASFYKSFPGLKGTHFRLYHDLTRNRQTAAGYSPLTTTMNTHLSARHALLPNLNLSGDCRIRNTEHDQEDDETLMSLSAMAEYRIFDDTTLDFTYELNNLDLREDFSTEDWSVLFGIRHVFDLTTGEKWGRIKINVFEDLNGNDKQEAQEPGVENVLAYVVNGRAATTDINGKAIIEKVVPGKREVRLDISDLALDKVVKGEPTHKVLVEPLKTARLTFMVVTSGKIKGRVFADMDNNGIFEKQIDIPLSNVRLFLTPDQQETLSFSDGSFMFEAVFPGTYQVNIDLEWVPKEYKMVSPDQQEVKVKATETVEGVDFILQGRPLEIKQF
ncbi:stalk domain-containing protein [Candidatus Omnitrophota bacterium]